jgi:hypothetical protein
MTPEYEERGLFKQLIVIAAAAYVLLANLFDSERFWRLVCALAASAAIGGAIVAWLMKEVW